MLPSEPIRIKVEKYRPNIPGPQTLEIKSKYDVSEKAKELSELVEYF